jgi:hypothetical protein
MKKISIFFFGFLLFVQFLFVGGAWGQATLLSPTGDGGFETGTTFSLNGWTYVGSGSRTWQLGTPGTQYAGSRHAYVGTTSASSGINAFAVHHFYKDFTIPAGATNVILSYYVKFPSIDVSGATIYDFLKVYNTTNSNTPVLGTVPSTGYTTLATYGGAVITNYTQYSHDISSLAGTTARLVFSFNSDGYSPHVSAFLDNISITYTPPLPCAAPTSLAATPTSSAQTTTSINGTFNAAASNVPSGYIVVRSTSATQPTTLALATALPAVGNTTAFGSGTYVEYVNTVAGSWTSTGLSAGTPYYYYVFSYNNTSCSGGPAYSASATPFNQSTVSCPGTSLGGLSYSSTPVSYCLSSAITTNAATLTSSTTGIVYTVSPALPAGLSINSSTGAITGTPTAALAAADYTVTANNGCTSTTAIVNIATLALPVAPVASAATSLGYTSFSANWATSVGATTYLLDVATDSGFTSMVSGYNGLDVGNVQTYSVIGLSAGNTYYYRVRASNGSCTSSNSATITATTTAITSIATGNWNATTTWNSGTVPTCGDIITIASTHNVTINSASNVSKNLTIASGGTLTVASGDLTVGCTLNNTPLTNNGTLTVSGGTLNVNGYISSSGTFVQNNGNINVDPNASSVTANSTTSAQYTLNLSGTVQWTGGILTLIDPPATSSSSHYSIYYNSSNSYDCIGHTIVFGDGVSSTAGGNAIGFLIYNYVGSGRLNFGHGIINGPSSGTAASVNRIVQQISYSNFFNGNFTINSGGEFVNTNITVGGNVTVNSGGILTSTATLNLAKPSGSSSAVANTSAQTIGGSGTFQNLASSSTANLTSLTINNTSSAGVTISTPLSISGTLTMTAGKINTTTTNLLTLGTTTAAGTLSYTAGQIVGPFARTFATSSTSTALYDATTLFPVGDGTNYTPIHIDPVNGAGPVVMRGEAFNTNSGSAGIGMASPLSNDRWEALATSGSSNLTSCFVGLNDAQIATGNVIAQSSSANGTYNVVGGASTFVSGTPNALRTATAIPIASYTGFFTYAAPGPAITSFTPASACPNAATTITVTGTNLGSATSVTLNGEACTIVTNTATSLTFTTDATPQAGNIVVTTAANSATSPTALTLFTLPTVTASSDAVNNTICSGTSITLNGAGATTYTWNNSVTNSEAFAPTSSTTYTVTGTDGNACTNTASIAITVNNNVLITTQSTNQSVQIGTNATFSVVATGTNLTYQWQEFDGMGAFTDISGETSSSLVLINVSNADNGRIFHCVISGTCSSETSNDATLTASSIGITTHPADATICNSGSTTLSMVTSGTITSYQWQISTDNQSNWTDISGANSSTLILSGLSYSSPAKVYRCNLNSGTLYTNGATVTVYDQVAISSQPSSQTICTGSSSVSFSVTATGSNPTYQWQVSTNSGSTWANVASGGTSATYTLSTPSDALNGTQYKVVVTGSSPCTAVTSNAVTLNVIYATIASSVASGCINTAFTLTATLNGNPTNPSYSWECPTTGSGATTAITSNPASITPTATGTFVYTLTAGSTECPTVTKTVSYTVNALPNITSATATPSTVCSGAAITLTGASVPSSAGTATLGSGSSTSTSAAANPFYGGYGGVISQYLIKASELIALNVVAGNISNIKFDVTSVGSSLTGLGISIGNTSLNALTTTIESNLTSVYYNASYTPVTGINTISFSSLFNWDGVSNIIVSFCWSNNNTSNTSTTLKVYSPGFTSSNARYVDSKLAADVCSYTGSATPSGWNGASTTSSSRPIFIFDGQIGAIQTSLYSWSWNSTPAIATASGSTTETNTGASATSKTYTVTATNATTGCVNTATTSAITINPATIAPTATNSSQCGTATPTCSVTGTGTSGNTFKWYTVANGGTALTGQTASTLTSYPISATTSFYVSEFNTTCESPRVQVTASVTAAPTITAAASVNPVCSGSASVLSVTSANSDYTYTWSNSAGTGASVSVNPTNATTYTVTGTDASGGVNNGCIASASIVITTNAVPSAITLTPATTTDLCMGDIKTIVASGGNLVSQGNITLGTGNSTLSTSDSYAAFNGYRASSWIQTIYTASELSALGLGAGNITSIAYKIDSQGSSISNNITIKIGTISATSFATTTLLSTSAFTTVYGPTSYTHTASGWQTITFASPYNWDGVSNIVVDVWQDGPDSYSDPATYFSTTSDNKVNYTWDVTPSSTPPTGFSTTSRFNVRFKGNINTPQPISWSPTTALFTNSTATTAYTGNPTTVYAKPTATTTYTATATTAAGCTSSASVAVTVATPSTQTLANNDYVWRGTTNTDWSTAANWVKYDGTTYAVASTSPVANDNVFIPQNNTCVVNQPSIGTGTVAVNAVYIEPSATVTGGSGSLDVKGDFTNNGTFTAGTGTVSFTGSAAQQLTGATTFYNLTENNAAGLTLNSPVLVSNGLTMTAGNITTSSTNLLTLGNSAPATLTWTSGKVVGPMKRWMAAATNSGASSSLFPLGNATRKAQASIEYTTAPTTAGYLEAKFIATSPANAATNAYATLTDQFNYVLDNVVTEGYWEIKPSTTTGVAGGTYTVNLEGDNISLAASTNASYTDVRVIKSPDPHTSWILQGDHGTATGANADFTVSRTGMSGYSFFAMAFPSSAPLPVELVSFAANCDDNNTVSVNWTTASEHNSDYYTVEKSRDGISWNVLKTIPAAGNSTQLINYSVADASDISGTVYYRLTQVDIDGASKMYDIISTSCSSEKELALIAYPNPSNGQFTVKIENALGGKYDLAITDMQGKTIEEQSLDLETGTTVVKLNPVGLQPGVYLLQFMQDGNMLQQQKLVIE